jgi:hypothetical protein
MSNIFSKNFDKSRKKIDKNFKTFADNYITLYEGKNKQSPLNTNINKKKTLVNCALLCS